MHCSRGTIPHFGLEKFSPFNICYYHQDLHPRRLRTGSLPDFHATAAHLLLAPTCSGKGIAPFPLAGRPGVGPTLSAIHFQGGSVRQVSCYTLLGGFQLPWPPPCCQYRPTPFSFPVSVLRWAPQPSVRFIPQRQFCLPKMAHSAPVIRGQSPCEAGLEPHPLKV